MLIRCFYSPIAEIELVIEVCVYESNMLVKSIYQMFHSLANIRWVVFYAIDGGFSD